MESKKGYLCIYIGSGQRIKFWMRDKVVKPKEGKFCIEVGVCYNPLCVFCEKVRQRKRDSHEQYNTLIAVDKKIT